MEEDRRGDISIEHIGRVEGQAHAHHSKLGRKSSIPCTLSPSLFILRLFFFGVHFLKIIPKHSYTDLDVDYHGNG